MLTLQTNRRVDCSDEKPFAVIIAIMADQFLFVDSGVQHDRAAKRRMRQHVMKGKNAGRRISRPSKLSIAPRGKQPWYPGAVDEGFGIAFEMVGLPVKVTSRALRVINECTPTPRCRWTSCHG